MPSPASSTLPADRLRLLSSAPPRAGGAYVLYWMTSARRTRYSFGLERAVDWALELGKPLVVLEGLRAGHRYACARFHAFVAGGMADQARRFAQAGVTYLPYVEPAPGQGRGLLEALAARACLVVGDDYPCFFLPRMLRAAGEALARQGTRLEAVDGNGLYPLRASERVFSVAHSFRRHLQHELLDHLSLPREDPLAALPRGARPADLGDLVAPWPSALDAAALAVALERGEGWRAALDLAALPIDQAVGPVEETPGGEVAGGALLEAFLARNLDRYGEGRNEVEDEAASGLSPYLHWGQIGSHEVFARLVAREGWSPERVALKPTGSREGFWGLSRGGEAFLDQLLTWRELGFNRCAQAPDYDRYEGLPDWARETLAAHARDPRPHLYSLEDLREARTSDEVWNAAQRELVQKGRIHNYLRMLWGKKVLEWSRTPQEAYERLLILNDTYALDGRDPNSYSGISWTFGRYDRAWGPERAVFGKVRYMSSESAKRKLKLKGYLARFGANASLFGAG